MDKNKLVAYAKLMRLHRPIGIWLLLWPSLWSLWIAGDGYPHWTLVIIFFLGTVLMRSAGCVINDLADRRFDGHVKRTKDRPLVTGKVSSTEALGLFAALCLLALLLILPFNLLTFELAVIGFLIAVIYPFCKRFTYWPQVILGAAFGWGVPMAFAAQIGHLPFIAWWLFIITAIWIFVYDTMYAMVDRDDDVLIGVKSTAIKLGNRDCRVLAILQLIIWLMLLMLGIYLQLNRFFYLALLAAGGLLIYFQFLIKDRNRENCFKAFLSNNWFGAIIFIGILAGR